MKQIRAGIRIPLELPVLLRWKGPKGRYREVQGTTENISGNGLFVKIPTRLRRATPVTCTVKLPAALTKFPLELLCQGRVVRWDQTGELRGVGAVIDDYEFRPAHLNA